MESGHLEGVPQPYLGNLLTVVINHFLAGIILQDTVIFGVDFLEPKSFGFEAMLSSTKPLEVEKMSFPPDLSTNERTFHVNSIWVFP